GLLGSFRRADMIVDAPFLQIIKNVRTAVHAARLERTLLFREVVERNVFEGNVVKIEVAAEIELPLDEFREPAAEEAPAAEFFRQPAERTQRFERGVLRVIHKVTPVAIFCRPTPVQ